MATENVFQSTTIEAKADLSSLQYFAIALDDGQRAVNGAEACGILMNKPAENRFAQIGIKGEMKFRTGGALTAGKKLTVDSNSTFIAAGSGFWIVGTAKKAVTSGSIGTGLFDFTTPVYAFSSSFVA